MEYRQLGASGLHVPVLSFGTAKFGGGNDFFLKQIEGSLKRLGTDYIDVCHMHGFDGNTPSGRNT